MAPKTKSRAVSGKNALKKVHFNFRRQAAIVMTLAVAFMMLIVPLSACIGEDYVQSISGGGTLGNDSAAIMPDAPEPPETPGSYSVVYIDEMNNKDLTKSYDGTFAYAIPLPSGWTSNEKIFAGWSTDNITGATTDNLKNGELIINKSDDTLYKIYDVYDDIVEEGVYTGGVITLYAVWLDKPISDTYSYNVSSATSIKDAYDKLNPDGTTTTNRINFSNLSISKEEIFTGADGKSIKATITGSITFSRGTTGILLRADTVFETISLIMRSGNGEPAPMIYCYGNDLTFGEGVNTNELSARSGNGNISYAVPLTYKFITVCAGGLATYSDNMHTTSSDDPATIKLISGQIGRVSGAGRSCENISNTAKDYPIYSKIIVWGDADVGTVAGGHIDSNTSGSTIIEVRSGTVVNLAGGCIGNSTVSSTFYGNIEMYVYDGTVGVIYGSGLGRSQNDINALQVTLSGSVSIFILGGKIGLSSEEDKKYDIGESGHIYGGGASSYVSANDDIAGNVEINIYGGEISGNVYGGGYGYSPYVLSSTYNNNGYKSGIVDGNTSVNICGGTISGNVYGGGKGYNPSKNSAQVSGNVSVAVSGGTISGNVYGGGKGFFTEDFEYTILGAVGESAKVTVSGGTIYGSVYGGGELGIVGTYKADQGAETTYNNMDNSLDGAPSSKYTGLVFETGNSSYSESKLVISSGTIYGSVYGGGKGTTANIIAGGVGKSTLIISGGNIDGSAYGGGALAFVGSATIDLSSDEHVMTASDNNSSSTLIILNGEISGDAYGGGFGPRATINGSTYVFIGTPNKFDTNYDEYGSAIADLNLNLQNNQISINGSVYGGGEMGSVGFIEYTVSNNGVPSFVTDEKYSPVENISSNVNISNGTIKGSVYGGGKGGDLYAYFEGDEEKTSEDVPDNPEDAQHLLGFAVIYGSTVVYINGYSNDAESKLKIEGSVYGGGRGVENGIGSIQYAEVYDSTNVEIHYSDIKGSVFGGGDFAVVGHFYQTQIDEINYPSASGELILYLFQRMFCGDDIRTDGGKYEYGKNGYKGTAETNVSIYYCNVGESVFGGGKGSVENILSGAVGRKTHVNIYSGNIEGDVYGGGKQGIVGSVEVRILTNNSNASTENSDAFPTIVVNVPHILLNDNGDYSNLNTINDMLSQVNVYGGVIKGSVYGAGEGQELVIFSTKMDDDNKWIGDLPNIEGSTYTANKLSVFGRTEVNISGGEIYKHVYGGSRNGSTGSLTIMKGFQSFLDEYNSNKGTHYADISEIPSSARDGYDGGHQFNAAFVNIIGGMIYGNVFGGGYFGAIYGDTHVHIGENAVSSCEEYNDVKDNSVKDNTEGTSDSGSKPNLGVNGSVFGGGDRGDPSKSAPDYNFISVYGNTNILIDGEGYATGINSSADKPYMYITGSVFGSGNSCTTFYSDTENARVIEIKNYDATGSYVIYSIQRATSVTLSNSKLRLPGRSDGSNADVTTLYSLNHINKLTLHAGSTLELDTIVQDLRQISSTSGANSNTSSSNPLNGIQLNNGITLVIAKAESQGDSDSTRAAIEYAYGKVNGYFYLDIGDPDYYGGYVYGYYENPNGGFVRGNTLSSPGELVNFQDMGKGGRSEDDEYSLNGYRVWSAGSNHLGSAATLVAKNSDEESSSQSGFKETSGIAYLPVTTPGVKYKLIGFTTYPAQANRLAGTKSLNLLSVSGGDDFGKDSNLIWDENNDEDSYFGLSIDTGEGFETNNGDVFTWITPDNYLSDRTSSAAIGGTTLPEVKFTLYHKSITKTGQAGTVEVILQEQIPDTQNGGKYLNGSEIKIAVSIGTENAVKSDTFEGNLTLYTTNSGSYDWTFAIPPSDENTMYELYLDSVDDLNGFTFADKGDDVTTNCFRITMSTAANTDNSMGWSGYALKDDVLQNGNKSALLGIMDGRSYASLHFTLECAEDHRVNEYATGSFTISIKAYVLDSSGSRKLDDNSGNVIVNNWKINVNVDTRLPQYYVYFDTQGGSSIPTQFVDENSTVSKPQTDPVFTKSGGSNPEFLGWYNASKNEDGSITYGTQFNFGNGITQDTTVYAAWGYTITYDSNGADATAVESAKVMNGQNTIAPTAPSRSGYTFTGWYTEAACTSPFTFGNKLYENITLYAGWIGREHKLTYDLNGHNVGLLTNEGSQLDLDEYEFTFKTGDAVPVYGLTHTTIVSGDNTYYFTGWKYNSSETIYSAGSTFTMPNGDVTLTAVWDEVQNYIVTIVADPSIVADFGYTWKTESTAGLGTEQQCTFSVNKQFTVENGTYVFIDGIITDNIPGVSGYKILVNDTEQTNNVDSIQITESTTITIKFTCEQYDLTLNPNGGSWQGAEPKDLKITYAETYSVLNGHEPARAGYTFAGWYTEAEGGSQVTAETQVTTTKAQTLYAHWTPNRYTVSFNGNGGTGSMSDQSFVFGTPQNLAENSFTYAGYTFLGWALRNSESTAKFSNQQLVTVGTSDDGGVLNITSHEGTTFTLYAVWKQDELNVFLEKNSYVYNGLGQLPLISIDGSVYDGSNFIKDPLNPVSSDSTVTEKYDVRWFAENGINPLDSMPVNVGKYTVTVTDSSGATGTASFSIVPYTGSLHIVITNKTYDGTANIPGIKVYMSNTDAYPVIGNISDLFNITYKINDSEGESSSVTPSNAGTYTVTLTAKSDAGNFYSDDKNRANGIGEYIINKAEITGVTVNNYSGTYDGNDYSVSVTGADGYTVKYSLSEDGTWSDTEIKYKDVTNAVTIYVQISKENYETKVLSGTVTITQAPLEITIDNQTIVYGTETLTLDNTKITPGTSQLIGSENFTVTLKIIGSYTHSTAAGQKFAIVVDEITGSENTGFKADNYNITYKGSWNGEDGNKGAAGTLTVSKKQIIVTIKDKTIEYGDSVPTFGSSDYDLPAEISGLTITLSTTYKQGDNAGSYAITGTCTDDNYNVLFGGSWNGEDGNKGAAGTLTVSKKQITVSITAEKTYDGSIWSGDLSDYQPNDLISGHTLSGSISTKESAAGTYDDVDQFNISDLKIASGSADVTDNYEITYALDVTIKSADNPPHISRYSVAYDLNGGTGSVPQTRTYYEGQRVTVSSVIPSLAGYVFSGWCDAASGIMYSPGDTFSMPARNVCLSAVWTYSPGGDDVSITVTFISDGELYAQAEIKAGTSLGNKMPSDPEKEYYTFCGWYTEDGINITENTELQNSVTAYALWHLRDKYVLVTYVVDNEIYMTSVIEKGGILTEPEIKQNSGKELNGWYADEELTVKFEFGNAVSSSITLYAEWRETGYDAVIWMLFALLLMPIAAVIASAKKVSFYMSREEEKAFESIIVIGGKIGDKLPRIEDNRFKGWYTEEGEEITEDSKITKGIKAYGKWDE